MKQQKLFILGMLCSTLSLLGANTLETSANQVFNSPFSGKTTNTIQSNQLINQINILDESSVNIAYIHRDSPFSKTQKYRDISPNTSTYSTGNTIEDAIKRASLETGLSEKLIMSVIKKESSFNPNAVSRTGALGLMQIMPTTGSWECKLDKEELLDPAKNVMCGASYLKKQIDYFGDIELALASYNAGPGAVRRAIEQVNSKNIIHVTAVLKDETAPYVSRIMGYLMEYERG